MKFTVYLANGMYGNYVSDVSTTREDVLEEILNYDWIELEMEDGFIVVLPKWVVAVG